MAQNGTSADTKPDSETTSNETGLRPAEERWPTATSVTVVGAPVEDDRDQEGA